MISLGSKNKGTNSCRQTSFCKNNELPLRASCPYILAKIKRISQYKRSDLNKVCKQFGVKLFHTHRKNCILEPKGYGGESR